MRPKFTVRCGAHGESPGCIACRHLRVSVGLKYFAVRPFPDVAPRVWQAWCEECHSVLEQEKGWSARAHQFADIAIICTPCYRNTMRRHRRVRLAA